MRKCSECSFSHKHPAVVGAHEKREHGIPGKSRSAKWTARSKVRKELPPPVETSERRSIDYQAMIEDLRQEWHAVNRAILGLQELQNLRT